MTSVGKLNVNDEGHRSDSAAHDNAMNRNKHHSNLVKGGIAFLVCIRLVAARD